MADLSFSDERHARLYGHILLEALSGPWARPIQLETGPAFTEMCRVLYERQRSRLKHRPLDLSADDIDWAAVRALAPLMLHWYDDEFHLTTGHDLEELRELGQLAVEARREYRTPRHAIAYAIGECEVVLPAAYFEDRSFVAAVPDESSWNLVVPECARDRRGEFLDPLRVRFEESEPRRRWVELSVGSMDELQDWVETRRRKRRDPRSKPPA
jgi:hypothetical protein